jgi:hypothetical protein
MEHNNRALELANTTGLHYTYRVQVQVPGSKSRDQGSLFCLLMVEIAHLHCMQVCELPALDCIITANVYW